MAKIGNVEYTDLHEALVAGSAAGSVVELLCDVDLTGINWEPIPNFLGKFDGKGHKISNLTITKQSGDGVGLFGSFSWGKNHAGICNFTVENVSIDAPNSSYVGGVMGQHGSDSSSVVSNVTVCGSINITGKSYVGGLVGHLQYNKLVDCHVIGDGAATSIIGCETAGQIGGLVGMTSEGSGSAQVWNCSVEDVTVKGVDLVGGIIGRMNYGARLVNSTVSDVNLYCAADVATAEVKIGTLVGGFAGAREKDLSLVIDCEASNVKLYTLNGDVVADRWTGTVADTYNVAIATGVSGDAFVYNAGNPKFTAGTFDIKCGEASIGYDDDKGKHHEVGLDTLCQTGYAPVANQDGTYTIAQVHTVTLKNGDAVVDTQVVVDGQFATNVVLDVEGFEGWTNENYTAAFDFATTAIKADITLFAWIEAVGPVIPVDDDEPLNPTGTANATAAAEAITAAGGDVNTWVETVYGEGGKIPASVLNATTPALVALAVANDLPITITEPTFDVEESTVSAATGVAAFEFTLKDGATPVDIKEVTDKVKAMVKYTGDLATAFHQAVANTEVSIAPAEGKIKVELLKQTGVNAGFMKVEPNQPAK